MTVSFKTPCKIFQFSMLYVRPRFKQQTFFLWFWYMPLFMNLYSVPNSQSTGPSLPLKVPRVLFPRVSYGYLLFYIFLVTVIPKANKSGQKQRRWWGEIWGQGERRTADVGRFRKDLEGSQGSTEEFLIYYVSFQVSTYFAIKTISFYYPSGPIIWWQIDGETMETVRDFIFLGTKITADGDCSHEIKDACSLEKKLWPT